METIATGDLVTVTAGGPVLNGIVSDVPSATKIVVAVVDPTRGPIFRSLHPDTLATREEEAPEDRALQLLIRRTRAPVHSSPRGGAAGGHGRSGHSRGAAHRATGR